MVNELIFYRFYSKNRTNFFHKNKDVRIIFSELMNLDGLSISKSFQTVFNSLGGDGFWNVGASGDFDAGFFAFPDSDGVSFQSITTGVWVGVSFVLGDFHSFDELSERSTISGSVFTDDSDFLGSFGHFKVEKLKKFSVSSTRDSRDESPC